MTGKQGRKAAIRHIQNRPIRIVCEVCLRDIRSQFHRDYCSPCRARRGL